MTIPRTLPFPVVSPPLSYGTIPSSSCRCFNLKLDQKNCCVETASEDLRIPLAIFMQPSRVYCYFFWECTLLRGVSADFGLSAITADKLGSMVAILGHPDLRRTTTFHPHHTPQVTDSLLEPSLTSVFFCVLDALALAVQQEIISIQLSRD